MTQICECLAAWDDNYPCICARVPDNPTVPPPPRDIDFIMNGVTVTKLPELGGFAMHHVQTGARTFCQARIDPRIQVQQEIIDAISEFIAAINEKGSNT